MSNDKRSKLSKIEKLRRILDNPYDTKSKKSISKNNKNLESIRRRLGESTISTAYKPSSEFLVNKSNSLEPRVTIYPKEKKPSESVEQIEEAKEKPIEEESIETEDLFEVEKVDVSERKFLQVIPKEKTTKNQRTSKKVVEFLPISTHNEKEEISR